MLKLKSVRSYPLLRYLPWRIRPTRWYNLGWGRGAAQLKQPPYGAPAGLSCGWAAAVPVRSGRRLLHGGSMAACPDRTPGPGFHRQVAQSRTVAYPSTDSAEARFFGRTASSSTGVDIGRPACSADDAGFSTLRGPGSGVAAAGSS